MEEISYVYSLGDLIWLREQYNSDLIYRFTSILIFKKSQLQLFAEVSVLILIANSISKRTKLKDLHFLISKHFTKCQLSKHCGTGIRIDIYSNGI